MSGAPSLSWKNEGFGRSMISFACKTRSAGCGDLRALAQLIVVADSGWPGSLLTLHARAPLVPAVLDQLREHIVRKFDQFAILALVDAQQAAIGHLGQGGAHDVG